MGGAEEDYFCDGLVEDIITALSRVRSLFVIARNSSFTYKGRAVDIRAVGRELGVRYVLEGSVRRAGNRVRVTGQLIEARTGNHLWAERFEGNAEDIFDLQDRVTASVVGAIAPQLEQAEIERAKRKDPTRLDAYDMLLRAKAALQRTRANSEGVTDALRLLSGALDLDPAFAAAYGLAARCYTIRKGQNWTENPSEEVARTFELARQAIEFGADDAVALADAGWALAYGVCDLEAGTTVLERALAIDSNLAIGWLFSGWLKTWAGEPEVAVEHLWRAMRLTPRDPLGYIMQSALAHAYYQGGDYAEAAQWAEKSFQQQRGHLPATRIAAASYALLGQLDRASEAIRRLREMHPKLRVSNVRDALGPYRPEGLALYEQGLRLAGLPE
jgi:TolB-like protein